MDDPWEMGGDQDEPYNYTVIQAYRPEEVSSQGTEAGI